MLKMVAKQINDGKPVVAFGLSAINITRLQKGQPMWIDGAELGLAFNVLIFAGETEESMRDELVAAGIKLP